MGKMGHYRWVGLAALLGVLLLLTPCFGGEETPPPPVATPAVPSFGSRGPVTMPSPSAPPVALLTDVRTGRHEGFDRVAFEFKGNLPGYRMEYVQPPIVEDASGRSVLVQGSAFLQVRFEPASGFDLELGAPVYTKAAEMKPGLPSLVEVQRTGDFEAVLTWVLGLRGEVDFRVTELREPLRVVIDVAHR